MITLSKLQEGQEDDYTTSCLLDYNCFKEYYKLTAKDLSKKQKLYPDLKAIPQINFYWKYRKKKCSNIEKVEETVLDFLKETVIVYDFILFQQNINIK